MKKAKLFFIILFFCPCLYSQNNCVFKVNLENTLKEDIKIFKFAIELYTEKDYYRAITEFLRFKSYCSEQKLLKITDLLIAEIYYQTQKWEKAIEYYNNFLTVKQSDKLIPEKFGNIEITSLVEYAEYKVYLCYIENNDYTAAEKVFSKIIENPGHTYYEQTKYVDILTYISKRKWEELLPVLKNYSQENSIYRQKYHMIFEEVEKYKNIPVKSPFIAGVFSAVLPGTGQFYTEKYGDGFTAIALTFAPLIATIDCYSKKAYFGTLVFGMFFISFYTANMYNAINSANKFNKNKNEEFYKKIVEVAKEESLFKSIEVETQGKELLLLFQ